MPLDVPQPPAIYRHYEGKVILQTRLPAIIDEECRRIGAQAPPDATIMACATPMGTACIIIMPPRGALPAAYYAAILSHERGHCAGWKG